MLFLQRTGVSATAALMDNHVVAIPELAEASDGAGDVIVEGASPTGAAEQHT